MSIADAAGIRKFALSIAAAAAGGETSGGRSALSIAAAGIRAFFFVLSKHRCCYRNDANSVLAVPIINVDNEMRV